jgi:hypothetical protein
VRGYLPQYPVFWNPTGPVEPVGTVTCNELESAADTPAVLFVTSIDVLLYTAQPVSLQSKSES